MERFMTLAALTLATCAMAKPVDPVRVSITSDAGRYGAYTLYTDITFTVRTSYGYKVRPRGASYLTFDLGGEDAQARCHEPEAASFTFTCTYTVGPGDSDDDGIAIPSDSLEDVNLARGESTINFLGRDDKLHTAIDDDADHIVDALSCKDPDTPIGESAAPPAIDATDLPAVVRAGPLVPLPELVRRDTGVTLSVTNADDDECVSFYLGEETDIEVVLTLPETSGDFDLRLYERVRDRRQSGRIANSSGTGDESIVRTLEAGTYDACAEPFGNASGDWIMDIDVAESES